LEIVIVQIEPDIKLDFKDVLIRPKRSKLPSRSIVDINRYFNCPNSKRELGGVPIVVANMDTVGTMKMARTMAEFRMFTALHKHYSEEDLVEFYSSEDIILGGGDYVFYSMGVNDWDKFQKVSETLGEIAPQNVCIDVANGYSEVFLDYVKWFRDSYPNVTIMAGNVVTNEMTEELILSGVDIVKVGIGPGSVCTTRIKTGVGYPQLSAIIECADAAHGVGGLVCGDGGITVPGDIAKAFGAGADFVMCGGLFSGHDECDGTVIYDEDTGLPTGMEFYGMSSQQAQDKHNDGLKEYRASEGKAVIIPYRGAVINTIRDVLGGLRSACTYVGAARLKELPKRTTFIRTTQQANNIFGE
jgi:GMP reductase